MEHLNDAVAVAQILLRNRGGGPPYSRSTFEEVASSALATLSLGNVQGLHEAVVRELEARHTVSIGVETVLEGIEEHVPWYLEERARPGPFADRYFRFLLEREGWPAVSVASLETTTARIVGLLEDPTRAGPWDRRGLVVGHVQSGKTASYAGVICRAADAGYKLIVVLGGMHNALRAQTQQRLDRDFLGYESSATATGGRRRIGVGEIDGRPQAYFLTTRESSGDFSAVRANNLGMGVGELPVLLVVKKNASILRNLNAWVADVLAPHGRTQTAPLLVIDDEADQASVDTSDPLNAAGQLDPDHDPTRINAQIRRLLNAFTRSAYVAYTATPFANILIHDESNNRQVGEDLFPRSFIVNLPAPSNYVGPDLLFGDEAPELVRVVDQDHEDWVPARHDSGLTPRYRNEAKIPPSLEEAAISFLLACAARRARGQVGKHNTMLVHVSRFRQVHRHVHGQLSTWLDDARARLRYGVGAEDLEARMRAAWERDFASTTRDVMRDIAWSGATELSWDEVRPHLNDAIAPIAVRLVNSDITEPLDYENYKDTGGLNVIAVGGDKLSRGLTLEGLTVSYFLRASRMYDSLMQMGRWFGYRPGYLDLCRLYMPAELRDWFEHVAVAAEDLRDQLDHMAALGETPKDYGLRVETHDVLLVTAANKQRHGEEFDLSYAGRVRIPTLFSTLSDEIMRNARLVEDTLAHLGNPEPRDDKALGYVWQNVHGTIVRDFIRAFSFHPDALEIRASVIADYIAEQLTIGELTSWTISLREGDSQELAINLPAITRLRTVERKREPDDRLNLYKVRTVLSPHDEAIDLTPNELYQRAMEATRRAHAAAGKTGAPRIPGGVQIRNVRPATRGLLLLYPLDPALAGLDTKVPIYAPVISFPNSPNARSVRVLANTVYQRQEFIG